MSAGDRAKQTLAKTEVRSSRWWDFRPTLPNLEPVRGPSYICQELPEVPVSCSSSLLDPECGICGVFRSSMSLLAPFSFYL